MGDLSMTEEDAVNPAQPAHASAAADPAPTRPDGPAWARLLPRAEQEHAERVAAAIGEPERLGVAFSGGVDSTVLLALAARALGPARTLAVLGVSPSLAASERAAAHDLAADLGTPLVEVRTFEGANAAYRANGPDRCFHCKHELFARISDTVAQAYGLTAVAYGENADDARRRDRPGSAAARDHAVLRPLAEAGLDKAAVRSVARAMGLRNADKPAAPCLASRIPHFEDVTPQKLAQVEAAERAVAALGFADCRVRHHGEVARLELPAVDLARAVTEPIREQLLAGVRAAGFRFVALDLAGVQSGAFTLPLVAGDG
ncbi:MAG TPA: asparagine synthase-related protein [Candidatus Nanopelagicales bacterium]